MGDGGRKGRKEGSRRQREKIKGTRERRRGGGWKLMKSLKKKRKNYIRRQMDR